MPSNPLNIKIALTNEESSPPRGGAGRALRGGITRGAYAFGGAIQAASPPIGHPNVPGLLIGQMTSAMEQMGSSLMGSGPGAVFGTPMLALAQVGKAAQATTGMLDQMTETYGRYSPEISRARADVLAMRTRFNIEQSKEHGAELAELAREKEKFNIQFERLSTKLFTKAAPHLIKALEFSTDAVDQALDWNVKDFLKGHDWSKWDWRRPLDSLDDVAKGAILEAAKKARERRKEKEKEQEAKKDDKEVIDRMLDAMQEAIKQAQPDAPKRNAVQEWMATHDQLELADINMPINAVIQKEVGSPAKIFRDHP